MGIFLSEKIHVEESVCPGPVSGGEECCVPHLGLRGGDSTGDFTLQASLFVFAAAGCPVFLLLDGPAVDTPDPARMLSLMCQVLPRLLKLQVLGGPALLGRGVGVGGSCAHWSRSSSALAFVLMSYFSTWAPGSLATSSCRRSLHQRP